LVLTYYTEHHPGTVTQYLFYHPRLFFFSGLGGRSLGLFGFPSSTKRRGAGGGGEEKEKRRDLSFILLPPSFTVCEDRRMMRMKEGE
jgi:hypothetical protein